MSILLKRKNFISFWRFIKNRTVNTRNPETAIILKGLFCYTKGKINLASTFKYNSIIHFFKRIVYGFEKESVVCLWGNG